MSYLIARKADKNDPAWGVVSGHVVLGIPRKTKKCAEKDMATLVMLNEEMCARYGYERHTFFLIEAETKQEAAKVLAEIESREQAQVLCNALNRALADGEQPHDLIELI